MNIEAKYKTARDETLRGQRVYKRLMRWSFYCLGLISVSLGILKVLIGSDGIEPILVGIGMAAFPELFLRWYLFRQRHLLNQDVKVTFTDDGVEMRSQSWDSKLGWANFQKVSRRGGFWIFSLTPYQALLFPDSFLNAEGSTELSTFLLDRGILKK